MSKVTFEEDELAVVALFQENTRKDTIDILKDTFPLQKHRVCFPDCPQ